MWVAQCGDHQYIALFRTFHAISVVYHETTILTPYILHACAVSLILSCLTGHNCKNTIRLLGWNMMGSTSEGWARVIEQVVLANIRRYGIVFLHEVPWAVKGTKKRFATPAQYEVVMTKSKSGNRNSCILYNPRKLQGVDADTDTITETIKSVQGRAH